MSKHVLHCLCWSLFMPVVTGWSVVVWCHLQRHHQHAMFDSLCALFMSTAQPQASADLQQINNWPNCRHALAGCNLVSLRLSSLPKLGQQRHTCCSVRQKHTSIASNFSIRWCLGCWLLGQPWMGQLTSLQHVFCLWLASQTVRQPSIKQCMLSRPCMVCGYYMVTSEKAIFCVYLRLNKLSRLYSLI